MKLRVKCNQNRIFGCDRFSAFEATLYVLGRDRWRIAASGRCQHCNLPLSIRRNARPQEIAVPA